MKNKLSDLNDHLFAQLERLGDESLKGQDLASEIERSKAIKGVASELINNATLVLNAEKFKKEYSLKDGVIPTLLEGKKHDV